MAPSLYGDKWYSGTLKSKLEDEVDSLCDENTIISRVPEGNVYHVSGYVVKERIGETGPKKGVYREYLIGKRMNQLNVPHMVKTCGYTETKYSSRLILGLVKGTTLSKFLKDPKTTKSDIARMMLHVVVILGFLQQKYGFCHYGLHSANVMIKPLNHRKKFTYNVYGREYVIRSRYEPVIIDLGRSFLRGVPQMYYEGERYEVLTTPGIFDGQIDYAYILWSTKKYLSLPKTCKMLRKNGLFRDDVDECEYKLNRQVLKEVPSKLVRCQNLWGGHKQCNEDLNDIIREYERNGNNKLKYYAKKLDGYCVYHKKKQIKSRKYSNKNVFRMLVKELKSMK
jgi:hypothetical protein